MDSSSAISTGLGNAPFARLLDANGNSLFTTENGALDVSIDSLLFWEQVDGNAVNTNTWNQSTSGMTIAQANGFLTLNSGSALTAGAYAILSSINNINLYGHLPVRMTMNAHIPVNPGANLVMELGMGQAATNAPPTDGVFFRWTGTTLVCVMNFGGGETVSPPITPPPLMEAALFDIVCVEDAVNFFLDDELVATIQVPLAQAYPVSAGHQPVFARCYNGGSSPAAAPQINIGQVVVVQEALNQNRLWREVAAIMGRGGYQSPVTPFGQTANHANSANPASATLSNTAASLATVDGAGVWGPRRIPIGLQTFLVGDLIGRAATDIVRAFDPPLIVDSARFLHVIAQIPFGTASLGQILRGDVTITGYFE